MKSYKATFDLFLISALGLFFELMLIRWTATEVRLFAYYKNFALISAFLGLGIGFALNRRTSKTTNWFEKYYFLISLIITVLTLSIGRTNLNNLLLLNDPNAQEFVWTTAFSTDLRWAQTIAFYTVALSMVFLLTIMFIPLGQLTAKKFAAFRPLQGYTINVIGSLTGILAFTLVSWLGWPPAVWFIITGAVGVYFLPRTDSKQYTFNLFAAIIPILLLLFWPSKAQQTVWSPYSRIAIFEHYVENNTLLGYDLLVNENWHQALWNLGEDFVAQNYSSAPDHFQSNLTDYGLPYQLANKLDKVLIVGAGTGNDVAGALRAGAKQIVAVEIDPRIIRLGQELHPEAPYADPRVEIINQDARSYFKHTQEKFDLIVFGRLDSQTLFSTASSVRLDNFVYTQESFEEVRNLLTEDGLVALSFWVDDRAEWVGLRLFQMLTHVFGYPPQGYRLPTGHTIFLTLTQPLDSTLVEDAGLTALINYFSGETMKPTMDNWPYLYLREPTIPAPYLLGLLGVAIIGILLIQKTIPDFKRVNLHFFFLGSAFFLLETKSITELALLLGSTWIVNAVVIAAILVMIVVANILVERFDINNCKPYYGLLVAALTLNLLIPIDTFLGLSQFWQATLAGLAQALPLFFAGIIFAVTFKQTDSIESALGSNLIGAVLGGLCEYSSLIFGTQSLYIFALVLYILSALALFIPANRMFQQTAP